MIPRLLLAVFLVLSTLPAAVASRSDLPPETDRILFDGLDRIHRDDYDGALSNFARVQALHPDHPAGYFFYAAALEWLALDFRTFSFGDTFFTLMKKTVEVGQARLKKDPRDPWANFYVGAGLGFMGITYIKYGDWWRAFFDGTSGYNYLKKALEVKPDMADALFGIGQFHYWRAKKAAVIRVFGGKNDMALGISQLERATREGYYSTNDTKNALVTIYWLEGQYDKSIALIEETMKQFPDYCFSFWALAQNYRSKKEYAKALASLDRVEKKLATSKYTGALAWVDLHTQRAANAADLGDGKAAHAWIAKARAVQSPELKSLGRFQELLTDLERIEKQIGR